MIKDRGQKKIAARYCAVLGIVPFLEVIVRSPASLEDAPVDITDIDVLGVEIGQLGHHRRTLFDCKTANRQSAINRALWASGLRDFVGADTGFIIQTKSAPDTHRLAASTIGIQIHSEDSFSRYASSLNTNFDKEATYLDNIDLWDDLLSLARATPALAEIVFFNTTQAALEQSGQKGVRTGLSALIHGAGELDPRKRVHALLFGCAVSNFLLHTSFAVSTLKDSFDFQMSRSSFEKRLRYFLWEGRDNYELRVKLRRALAERAGSNGDAESDFDLPSWRNLIELIRAYLEAPEALSQLPLLAKEVAFRSATPAPKFDADRQLHRVLTSNKRARQFLFLATAYLAEAANVPQEFRRSFELAVNGLV